MIAFVIIVVGIAFIAGIVVGFVAHAKIVNGLAEINTDVTKAEKVIEDIRKRA